MGMGGYSYTRYWISHYLFRSTHVSWITEPKTVGGPWDLQENSSFLLHSPFFLVEVSLPSLLLLEDLFPLVHLLLFLVNILPLLYPPTQPMSQVLSCFWDRKLLCFVLRPTVSLSICSGPCGGVMQSSEYTRSANTGSQILICLWSAVQSGHLHLLQKWSNNW